MWARLDERARAQTIDYLATFIGGSYPPNNWAWFRITVEQFLESVGGPFSTSDREEDFALLDAFDLPGGWITDGHGRNFDHYCGWALPFYPIFWSQIVAGDARHAERGARYARRLDDYLDDALHLIGADGGPLIQGRSLTYRFATAGAAWAAAIHGGSRHDPGALRRAASGQVRHFVERGAPDANGILAIGWHHPWPAIAQNYSGPGSPYWAAKGMAGLALPADHPVWTAVEQPLPIDRGSFARVLTAPGWLVSGTADDGVVRLVNHGTDHRHEGEQQPDAPLYAKFGYSTATAPVLAGDRVTEPLDGVVAVVREERTSHRSGFRAGPTAHLDADTMIGSSLARAHWPLDLALTPDHGVTLYDGPTRSGPAIDVVSVVRGVWEVRFVRIHPGDTVAGDRLRVGGWALTAPDARAQATATTAATGSGRAHSRLCALAGLEGATAGVDEQDDVTPLAGRTHIPWIEAPVAEGAWHVVGVALGSAASVEKAPHVLPQGEEWIIAWPTGGPTVVAPSRWVADAASGAVWS